MSKLLPVFSGVACILWVSGWTWILTAEKKPTTSNSIPSPINILIDSAQYEVQHPFAFDYADATPIVAENLHPAIKSVVKKLGANPKSQLIITGIFSTLEENQTSFPNLGLARAESVKSILEASGAVGEQIETVGLESTNLFQIDGKLTGAIYFSFSEMELQALSNQRANANEEEVAASDAAHSFYYKHGDYKVEKKHLPVLKKLVNDLKKQASKKVLITGYSAAAEEAESSRINLAEMRALAVRRYLIDHGVRREQIEVRSKPSMARESHEMTVSIQVQG